MVRLTTSLFAGMNERLDEIAKTSENNLQLAERSYHTIQATLLELKEYIQTYQFKDQQEEILFFKEIKPRFLKELIFYMEVFYLEAGKPVGNTDAQTRYYKQASERINIFFERNHTLYIYYRMGKDNLDTSFFVRGGDNNRLQPEYSLDIDSKFSTVHSFKLSEIQAYEQLNEYVEQALYVINHPDAQAMTRNKKNKNLWTDSKAALIELAYAIHSRGAVNNGKGDVKQIIADLEMVFNVQLGNFYRTFQSMRTRKKNRTPFLDTLKDSLEKRMDDTDLNYY